MKTSSELRAEARTNLSNKWGQAILVALIYVAVTGALSSVSSFIPFSSILLLIITIPFAYGFRISFLKLKRDDNFSYGDIFTEAFKNFKQIWIVTGNICLKLIVPIILLVVAVGIILIDSIIIQFADKFDSDIQIMFGIISLIILLIALFLYCISIIFIVVKGLYYALSYYLLYDNPNMSGKEIVNLSESLMKNQRGQLFVLQLSFVGWSILALLTCGIGNLFLLPYIQFAIISFYEDRVTQIGYNSQL